MSDFNCKFCNTPNRIQMYSSTCQTCQTEFLTSYDVKPTSWTWKIFSISYNLHDQETGIYKMVMNLREETTKIWFYPVGTYMDSITIPKVFPDTLPQDALNLAKKLKNLVIFS